MVNQRVTARCEPPEAAGMPIRSQHQRSIWMRHGPRLLPAALGLFALGACSDSAKGGVAAGAPGQTQPAAVRADGRGSDAAVAPGAAWMTRTQAGGAAASQPSPAPVKCAEPRASVEAGMPDAGGAQSNDAAAFDAAAGAAAMSAAQAQPAPIGDGPIRVLHIHTEQGESKLDELSLAPGVFFQNTPATSTSLVQYAADELIDWHNAPARQFVVGIAGESEYEVAGGVKHAFKPGDLLFVEDLQGRGHISRTKTGFTHMFVRVPDNFDVIRWARGEP